MHAPYLPVVLRTLTARLVACRPFYTSHTHAPICASQPVACTLTAAGSVPSILYVACTPPSGASLPVACTLTAAGSVPSILPYVACIAPICASLRLASLPAAVDRFTVRSV